MTKKYIIGGGISGLIWGYYHSDYTIIEPGEVGGRLNRNFFKNIIYFHRTPETIKFLDEVGIKYKRRTQLIKYLVNDKVTQDISKADKINLIKKKLDDKDYKPKDLSLSTNDYFINILEFSFVDLIAKLKKKVNVIKDKVIRITDTEIICENSGYEYDHLVSTIPANFFWDMYHRQKNIKFESKPVTFVLSDTEPAALKDSTYDMLYVIDKKYKYNRISKKPSERDKTIVLYEFTGKLAKEEVSKYLPKGAKILEYYIDYAGVIFSNSNNIAPNNVTFLGRFATWAHQHKQQDVIKSASWNYDMRNIWARQKTFMANRIDFNSFGSIEAKEKESLTMLMHLHSELAEVQEELNYKLHKKKHEVDVDKIKEELMDNFKYLLNLFIIWGVDANEFVQLFNSKSKKVEDRYEKEWKDE